MPKLINVPVKHIKLGGVFIWDGMVLVHSVLNKKKMESKVIGSFSFADAAADVIASGIQTAAQLNSSVVHIVFDPYPTRPIPKGIQTAKRQGQKKLQKMSILPNGSNHFPTSDSEGFLAMNSNKRGFVDFVMASLIDNAMRSRLMSNTRKNVKLIMSNGSVCIEIYWSQTISDWHSANIDTLINNHDEADTMLILHLNYALEQQRNHDERMIAYVRSVDTDVLVLLLANCKETHQIYFIGGTGLSISGIWDITKVIKELGPSIVNSILAWHVITGRLEITAIIIATTNYTNVNPFN